MSRGLFAAKDIMVMVANAKTLDDLVQAEKFFDVERHFMSTMMERASRTRLDAALERIAATT